MPTKQVHDLRVGDIFLFKNKKSRIITRIDYNPHKRESYDRYGLPETFRCGPFDRVLKVVDRGGLF